MNIEAMAVVAFAIAAFAGIMAIGAHIRLDKALKPKPVTPSEPVRDSVVDPFTLEDVAKLLEIRAGWAEDRARKTEALERAGLAHQYDEKSASHRRDESMFRCAARLVRQAMEAETISQ
jgi:hypothetical protein